MPVKKKSATTTTDISITAAAEHLKTTEQSLRLALIDIRPDDFDTVKTLPKLDFEAVAKKIQQQQQSALPAPQENLEAVETRTTQALQLTSESESQPQNSPIVPAQNSQPTLSSQHAGGSTLPVVLDELMAKTEDDIALADLVHVYRNEQILANAQTRDRELIIKLREQRNNSRNATFDRLRELNSKQPITPELPEIDSDLQAEINRLSDELGKNLALGK